MKDKFNVSFAEASGQDNFRETQIGIVSISDDRTFLEALKEKIFSFLDSWPQFEVRVLNQEFL